MYVLLEEKKNAKLYYDGYKHRVKSSTEAYSALVLTNFSKKLKKGEKLFFIFWTLWTFS